ncbi:MAG: SusD/RagB family nutrient-binding outer membrane lipoprotein [Bacteroidota bacterium]|nr:SusD/RagB family nutrient-binding outer membrane lipoprotein [Bacteroidota bacterium]
MKKITAALFVCLLIGSAGCKKGFLDINENPNSPTDASITPDLILPRAQVAIASRMATSYRYAGSWIGYWTRSGTYGPNTEEESYRITTTFEADEWAGWYDILTDLNTMEKKAKAAGQGIYEGIAKTLKTVGFMYLVDQYNNVPYSKAFDLTNNILPAYDKGQDIYNNLLVELDKALALFAASSVVANPKIAIADIMFKGDATSWRRFANTQRLKLLIRQSQVSGFNPAPQIAKIIADGSGYIGAGQTAYVQPGYSASTSPTGAHQQNPFWNAYEKLVSGSGADDFNRANNFVLTLMRVNNDFRFQYFFDPVATSCPSCSTPVLAGTWYGYNYGEVIDNNAPKAGNSSAVGGPGLAKTATQPQWVFTSMESMFLQAEAMQRGWITGNAQTMYLNAITESYTFLGVPNAAAAASLYYSQNIPVVDWSLATTSDAKVKLIVLQKYIALTGINLFEAYVDYRRLGVPATLPLSLSPSRAGFVIPLRLSYPQNEFNYNLPNVQAEGTINTQTSSIFWDR